MYAGWPTGRGGSCSSSCAGQYPYLCVLGHLIEARCGPLLQLIVTNSNHAARRRAACVSG